MSDEEFKALPNGIAMGLRRMGYTTMAEVRAASDDELRGKGKDASPKLNAIGRGLIGPVKLRIIREACAAATPTEYVYEKPISAWMPAKVPHNISIDDVFLSRIEVEYPASPTAARLRFTFSIAYDPGDLAQKRLFETYHRGHPVDLTISGRSLPQ